MKKKEMTREKFERIEAFLLNKLSEKERLAFEKELDADAELKKEVGVQRELMLAVETGEMKNSLNRIHQKITKQKSITPWLAVAASIIIFISVGYWLFMKPDKTERLFAANMTVDPGLPVPMSATNNYVFYDAMVDYKSSKYELAISKWQPLLNSNPENDTLTYFIGAAYFNAEKYKEALPYFEKISNDNQSSFNGKGEWYLALCFLKLKEIDRLKTLAGKTQSDYADRIKQLTQKLE